MTHARTISSCLTAAALAVGGMGLAHAAGDGPTLPAASSVSSTSSTATLPASPASSVTYGQAGDRLELRKAARNDLRDDTKAPQDTQVRSHAASSEKAPGRPTASTSEVAGLADPTTYSETRKPRIGSQQDRIVDPKWQKLDQRMERNVDPGNLQGQRAPDARSGG